jgi:hypothetical protein
MKFIDVGEGAQVEGLRVHRNIMIVNDLSHVESFISVGKNGKVINMDADGNEIHTPASYADKVALDRREFFEVVDSIKDSIELIADQLLKQKIKAALVEAQTQETNPDGEHKFKKIIGGILEVAKGAGVAVLANCISAYIGHQF